MWYVYLKVHTKAERIFLSSARAYNFLIMDSEINEVVIQYLRDNYQCSEIIGDHPITSNEIAEELQAAGFGSLPVYEVNKYLKRVGFEPVPIPGDADCLWLIKAHKF